MSRTNHRNWVSKLFPRLLPSRGKRRAIASRLLVEALENRVTPSGLPPTASAIPRQAVNEDASAVTLQLNTFFSDPESDPLTYTVVQTNSSGLVTPNLSGSNLTLSFAPNQFGYSYFQVTANDGSGSATAAFEVLVRAIDDLVGDAAATSKSAPVAISVLANDGAGDSIRLAEGMNVSVVQNDTGNAVTSVTMSKTEGTPGIQVRAGSNRGDYNLQFGTNIGVADGMYFNQVRENTRDNAELAPLAGPQTMTTALDSNAAGPWAPIFNAGNGSEYNVNIGSAYFPYEKGWIAGWAVNANGDNNAPNDSLRSATPNAGLTIGTAATFAVQDLGAGQLRVRVPGVSSQTDGILLAMGGKNEDNYAMGIPNADGSWQVVVRDNGSNGTNPNGGNEQDFAAFIYIPSGIANVVSGRILGDGSIEQASGAATIAKTGTGTYELTIPGHSPTSGILLLSPEGGNATTADNFVTYQPDGNKFIINSWDITSTTAAPTLEDPGAGTRMASFAFIPFLTTPALRVTSVQSAASVPNTSDKGATLTLNPDGTVGYDPTTSAEIQALVPGGALADTFTYTTTNLTGQTSTTTVTVAVSFAAGNSVDLVGGQLIITSTPGIANNMSVSFDGTNYTFTDPAATFSLSPAAAAVFSGSGTNTITGPSSAMNSLVVNTGDLDDTLTINGLNDPFTISGGGQAADTVAVAGAATFTRNATINQVATITTTGAGKLITPTGTVTLSAANFIGTAANNVLTQAATIVINTGAGGVFLTEDDGATVTASAAADGNISITSNSGTLSATATASGAGNINLANLDGTLNIAGITTTAAGNITLTSGDDVTLSADLNSATGLIAISANTDGAGTEGYDQKSALVKTASTTTDALKITLNTAGGGIGNAILGAGVIGAAGGGDVTVNANGGSILWSSFYTIPSIATSNNNTLAALNYSLTTSGANSSIGTLAAPIQTTNHANFSTTALVAGVGGIYFTDWGDFDMVITNANAQGAGNIQLISANAGGHNLSVLNANTGSGSITLIADDDLFIGSLNNAPIIIPGFIGDAAFSGTISMLANRDGTNDQRIIMRPGSIVQTTNATANAILMRTTATDNSPTDTAMPGITLTTVKAGNGGTITLDTAPILTPGNPPTHVGSIIQQDDTTVALDAGPNGTVVLNASAGLNGASIVNLSAVGDATSPLRINAGTINITSVNSPVRVAAVGNASVTATIKVNDGTVPPAPPVVTSVPSATLELSSDTGVLTIAGATNTDGGPITLTAAAGIVVNGVLGDANSGNIIVNASASDVVFNSDLTVNAGQNVTITDGNAVALGPVTTVNGTLAAPTGVQLSSGDVIQGVGTVTGPIAAPAGSTTSAGPGTGVLATGNAVINGTLGVELNSDVVGTGYDQVNVAGTVDLTGTTLNLGLGYVPVVGATYTIINNDGSDAVVGTFSTAFPLTAARGIFSVNYAGGDGNDVVLTVVNIRPIATFDLVVPNPRNSGLPSATINFSESVTGFDPADLSLTLGGSPVPLTGVTISGSGASYTINGLAGLTGAVGDYVLTLNGASSGIQDLDTPVGSLFGDASVSWTRSNNAAPVLDNAGAMSLGDILEEAAGNSGTTIAAIIASAGGDRITDGNGDPEGIAVTAIDSANGTWEYTIDNGANWLALSPVSDDASRLLAADANTRVRFLPNANFAGKVASGITFRAWDQTTGTAGATANTTSNGSSTSFSTATETASVYVITLPDAVTLEFQDGLNNYDGTADTELSEVLPDDPNTLGLADPVGGLLVDWHTTGQRAEVLLRFDSLFGTNPGQIPLGSIIVSAVLTVTTNNSGDGGTFHRMKIAWDEAVDTWNTFGDGLGDHNSTPGAQANNGEARSAFDSFAGPTARDQLTGAGRTEFGVTADLQAWSNGEANNGWAILPWTDGDDGWAFHSSEATDPLDRPKLIVKYLPAGSVSVAELRQDVAGYTGTVDTEIRQDQPDANRDNAGQSFIDFSDGNNNETQTLLKFTNLIGSTPLSIPAGANVAASALILPSTGGSAPGDGGKFHAMLTDWAADDSWTKFASGTNGRNATPGIQADGVEAAASFNFQAGNVSRTPDAQAAVNVFDATTDVQAWVNGASNFGWVGLPWNLGSNGWSFNQSDQATEMFRPKLVAYYTLSEREFNQLDIVAGALSFIGGGGADALGLANNLTVSLASGSYTFADPNGAIVLTPAAIAAGWTGSGTNTVTGPSSSVNSLLINTGTKNDTVTIAGADDPLSVNGGFSGGDTLAVTGPITATGDVSLFGFNAISQTAGTITAAGTIYIDAPAIGTAGQRLQTAAGSLNLDAGAGGIFVTEADDAAIIWAAATGAGAIDIASTTGALTVGGTINPDTGTITLAGPTGVVVNGAVGDAAGVPIAINGPLSGTGVIAAGAGAVTLTQATDSTDAGTLTGSGEFTKAGAGALTLPGATGRSGQTFVTAGSLIVANLTGSATGSAAVNVNGGALAGDGNITGAVNAATGGTVAPGVAGAGKLNTASVSLSSGAILKIDLNGTTAGTNHDQVNVAGTVNLNADSGAGATLNVAVGYFPATGDSYVIIANDGTDAVSGTFAGLAEGATLTVGSQSFTVSYVGGDGNDVVLSSQTTNAATTTTLVAAPQATTGGSLVTFTATIAPSPGALGTVTFLDNGTPIPGGSNVAVSGGQAVFSTTTLAIGTHPVTASYSGATGFASSVSNVQNVVITSGATPPTVTGVTYNSTAAFAATPGNATQKSRVVDITIAFDQAVTLDAGAVVLTKHLNSVVYDGAAQPTGMGTVPTTLTLTPSADNKTWVVTFSGASTVDTGADGYSSLRDGVYAYTIDATKVHPLGVPGVNMGADATGAFHRLFGDANAPTQSGADFTAVVNTGDNLQFRTSFNNAATYKVYFDVNGDGTINSGDNLQFRTRFNKSLTWKV